VRHHVAAQNRDGTTFLACLNGTALWHVPFMRRAVAATAAAATLWRWRCLFRPALLSLANAHFSSVGAGVIDDDVYRAAVRFDATLFLRRRLGAPASFFCLTATLRLAYGSRTCGCRRAR